MHLTSIVRSFRYSSLPRKKETQINIHRRRVISDLRTRRVTFKNPRTGRGKESGRGKKGRGPSEDLRVAQAQLWPSFAPDDGVRVRSVRVGLAEGNVDSAQSSGSGRVRAVFSLVNRASFIRETEHTPLAGVCRARGKVSRRARVIFFESLGQTREIEKGRGIEIRGYRRVSSVRLPRLYIPRVSISVSTGE